MISNTELKITKSGISVGRSIILEKTVCDNLNIRFPRSMPRFKINEIVYNGYMICPITNLEEYVKSEIKDFTDRFPWSNVSFDRNIKPRESGVIEFVKRVGQYWLYVNNELQYRSKSKEKAVKKAFDKFGLTLEVS